MGLRTCERLKRTHKPDEGGPYPCSLKELADDPQDRSGAIGLLDVTINPAARGFFARRPLWQMNSPRLRVSLEAGVYLDVTGCVVGVQHWHLDIHEDDVGRFLKVPVVPVVTDRA